MLSDQAMFSTYLYHTAQVRFLVQGLTTLVLIIILLEEPRNKPRTDRLKGLRNSELKIMKINARGLGANIGELANLCHAKQPSVVIIVKTFLNPSVPDGDDSIAIPGYCLCCRKDRLCTTGGHCCLLHGRNSGTS